MADAVARLHENRTELSVAVLGLPDPIARRLVDADVGNEQLVGLLVWVSSGVVLAVMAGVLLGPWSGASVVLLIVLTPCAVLIHWSGRRIRRTVQALPLFVEALARSLRSGASFAQALGEAGRESPAVVGFEVQMILTDIERGRPASSALRAWATRADQAEVRIVAAALAVAIQHESGASLSLAGVAQTLRDRAALRGEIRSLTAQAAASMQALVLLPVAFLSLDALSGRSALGFLTGHRFGQLCLALGIGLDIAGFVWMRSIVRRRLP